MVIGRSGVGKTTLLSALGRWTESVLKTEAIRFNPECIDTPGELLESPAYRHVFMTLSCKAGLILLVTDPFHYSAFPPGMARALRAPVLGVVTKADLGETEDLDRARKMLILAGAKEVFAVSSATGEGIVELQRRLGENLEEVW